MVTASELKSRTVKDLTQLARKLGVMGYSSMRKDQLVRALVKAQRSRNGQAARRRGGSSPGKRSAPRAAASRKGAPAKRTAIKRSSSQQTASGRRGTGGSRSTPSPTRPTRRAAASAAARRRPEIDATKNLAAPLAPQYVDPGRDQIVLLVLDPHWLHACWNVTHRAIDRIRLTMAESWHGARPTLRLYETASGQSAGSAERPIRDIEVHGGVRNWFIDVGGSRGYRVAIGYKSADGEFYSIARSNVVVPPPPGSTDVLEQHWEKVPQDCDRVYSLSAPKGNGESSEALDDLFEGRLRRPMGEPVVPRFCTGVGGLVRRRKELPLRVDAELIVFGSTDPGAHVTLSNEPVALRPDGTFTVRMGMPDRRQVIPVVALSPDGVEQRTVVLAVDRNTKKLDPVIRDDQTP